MIHAAEVSGNVCPMCKTRFNKVIHNVRANDDYVVVSLHNLLMVFYKDQPELMVSHAHDVTDVVIDQ